MTIYLDNCCFNLPFDDQKQLRIKIETEAKLGIQEAVRSGGLELAWSYILDFENENNPFPRLTPDAITSLRLTTESEQIGAN